MDWIVGAWEWVCEHYQGIMVAGNLLSTAVLVWVTYCLYTSTKAMAGSAQKQADAAAAQVETAKIQLRILLEQRKTEKRKNLAIAYDATLNLYAMYDGVLRSISKILPVSEIFDEAAIGDREISKATTELALRTVAEIETAEEKQLYYAFREANPVAKWLMKGARNKTGSYWYREGMPPDFRADQQELRTNLLDRINQLGKLAVSFESRLLADVPNLPK